jgi:cysteine desulfurase
MTRIYLDNNATTRPDERVVQAMQEALTLRWANPSSVHRFGQEVRQHVELARQQVARLVNAKPREVVFTSGGTEGNHLALHGMLDPAVRREGAVVLITNRLEHAAVREPAEAMSKHGIQVAWLSGDEKGTGVIEPGELFEILSDARRFTPVSALNVGVGGVAMVSVMGANNETGVIQPVREIAAVVRETRERWQREGLRCTLVFHCDGTQLAGKVPIDIDALGIDLLTIAAHKFHGPKGVGALISRRGVRYSPVQLGGPQEIDRRGGTENTPGIIGMGIAAELAASFVMDQARIVQQEALRDLFEQQVCEALPEAVVNGKNARTGRLWNTSSIGFPRLEAQAVLLGLSERGVYASAGAACSSGSLEPSPVLLAMGVPEAVAHGTVRFSLSRETTREEVDLAVAAVVAVVERLRRVLPV